MKDNIVGLLEDKLKKNFDIYYNFEYRGKKYDLFAKSHVKNIRTFLTKKDIIDCYENSEYIFVKKVCFLDINKVKSFVDELININKDFVKPNSNHMSTFITGFLIAENLTNDVKKFIKDFKYKKIYKFYLHGWSEVRIILVDLSCKEIIYSKNSKMLKRVLEAP
ncbi:hypothetical protein SAMN05660865_00617 [Caloramator fervidus]|uniref:DUF8052 domain-containing protein n=1 Tax=Caloramator fervidus TaxID=29344 RepID=A0A1H5TE71_9CLOT|nr:hypothetical protein [Caloramator fervidus]SEF61070.1 hypothetical protein SAMN05660865_00617 [Caloramator fervidus]